jgi:sugar lactone lactonase YvrE
MKKNFQLWSAARRTIALAIIPLGCWCGASVAAPLEIAIPGDHTYPESLTSTSDGTIIIGSLAEGTIFRVAPGATMAEPWIKAGTDGLMSVLGVLADEPSGTLWVCSDNMTKQGVKPPAGENPVALKSFDLKTGVLKGSVPLPKEPAFCNDIVIGPDSAAYVTDSFNPTILRLKPGATQFEVWATDDRFFVKDAFGLDGIAFGSDGNLYTNTYHGDGLFRVEVKKDGSAGAVTQLKSSREIKLPDGMRKLGNSLLLVEGAGRLDLLTVNGDTVEVKVLKDGMKIPVSVTQVGATAWVLEAQLGSLFDAAKVGPPSLPFRAYAVPLEGTK